MLTDPRRCKWRQYCCHTCRHGHGQLPTWDDRDWNIHPADSHCWTVRPCLRIRRLVGDADSSGDSNASIHQANHTHPDDHRYQLDHAATHGCPLLIRKRSLVQVQAGPPGQTPSVKIRHRFDVPHACRITWRAPASGRSAAARHGHGRQARGQARWARGEPPSITDRRLRFRQMRNER